MNRKNVGMILGTILSTLVVASTASASVCQVQSSSFYVRQYCALQARGYGEGSTHRRSLKHRLRQISARCAVWSGMV